MTEILLAERLTVKFGAVSAVNEVSFSVQTGERLALIGPNGAGKTTLFNMLNGQLKPTSGSLYFEGRDITHMSVYDRAHIGMARSFQIVSLFPDLTVYENAMLAIQGLKPYRYQPIFSVNHYKNTARVTHELLMKMDLEDKRDEFVENLAYGEQRRLEIILALASQPKLLLLDEPTCGLTATECGTMVNMIGELGEHMTVIIVAHDLDLVLSIATRIIVLHYGQLIIDGTPAEISRNEKVREIYVGIEEGAGYVAC